VKHFLDHTKKSFQSQNVLIVAHGGTLAAMMTELLHRPNREYPDHIQPTASIRRVQGRRVTWVHRPC
jgi:broad specificity phosphatase PhoE